MMVLWQTLGLGGSGGGTGGAEQGEPDFSQFRKCHLICFLKACRRRILRFQFVAHFVSPGKIRQESQLGKKKKCYEAVAGLSSAVHTECSLLSLVSSGTRDTVTTVRRVNMLTSPSAPHAHS